MLRKYRRVQERIIEHGLAEARIGNRYGFRRSLVLSIAKRACQGMWIWQYRHNALDAAMIMYLNMLTEQLLGSFGGYASLLERVYDGIEPTRVLVKLMNEKPAIADDAAAEPRRADAAGRRADEGRALRLSAAQRRGAARIPTDASSRARCSASSAARAPARPPSRT